MPSFLNHCSLESIAVVCGLCNIYLAARAHMLNWIFGIITVSLYFVIFFQAKLYADMSLQIIFFILQFYGWYQWLYGSATQSKLLIENTPRRIYPILFIIGVMINIFISWILNTFTDSTTIFIDAFATTLSLIAQWMMSRKWLEHWYLWMIVDVVSIQMYLQKQLYFTCGLYAVFFLCCIYGYFHWKQTKKSISLSLLPS